MPIYTYQCEECGIRLDQQCAMEDRHKKVPTCCGGKSMKLVPSTPASIVVKGGTT